MRRTLSSGAVVLGVLMLAVAGSGHDGQAQGSRPTFRSGVEVVRVTAIVHDGRGRPVTGLSKADFELFDAGVMRPIVEFAATKSPISLAILVDGSGSMRLTQKQDLVREAVNHLLSWIDIGADEAALLAFDTRVTLVEPFTSEPSRLAKRLPDVGAFGQTSLYDAIAETSQMLARRQRVGGAVVVVTDGADTSSLLGDQAVARLVSAIDVPVYVLVAAPPEPAATTQGDARATPQRRGPLATIAESTGGRLFLVRGPAGASIAARTLVLELRHQYLIGFEPNTRRGWHPLVILTRQTSLTVRARSGFFTGAPDGRP